MAKFTKIKQETCIACGACPAEAPEVYGELDSGVAYSLLDNNKGNTPIPEHLEEDVDFALEGCPTESLMVQDTPFE